MLSVHTILHPTDFSPAADCAYHLACALARDYQAKLIVVHVKPPLPLAAAEYAPQVLERPEYDADLQSRLDHYAPEAIAVERCLVEGDAVSEIVRLAGEHGADLIVMGTHGRTGVTRLLLGSVAELVLRRASCPVLTVKAPANAAAAAADVGEKARV